MIKKGLITFLALVLTILNQNVSARLGLTWSWIHRVDNIGEDAVGCDNFVNTCNAYSGDTSCDRALPILCVSQRNYARPPYNPIIKQGSAMSVEFYNGWSGGDFATTQPVVGNSILSLSHANKICSDSFGREFIAVHHHLGKYYPGMSSTAYYYNTWPSFTYSGAWNLYAYGNVPRNTRFWTFINDQRANCWN